MRTRMALLATPIVAAAACSPSQPEPTPTAPTPTAARQSTPLKVMTQQLGTDVALYIAKERGYFADQGLDVQFQVIAQGTTAIPLVSTGQLDVAVGAVTVHPTACSLAVYIVQLAPSA